MKVRKQFLNKRDEIMMMKTIILNLLIVLSLVVFPGRAEGTLIRHTFGGTITFTQGISPPAPWEGAGIGSIWELSYIFNTELPDQNPGDTTQGRYFIDNGSITMDGVELSAGFGEFEVLDGFLGFDEFRVSLFGTALGDGGVSLAAPSGTLASDAIPADLILADWPSRIFQFGGGGAGFNFFLQGNVLSFTSEVVPGPGAGLLMVLGSIVHGGKKRRRSPA